MGDQALRQMSELDNPRWEKFCQAYVTNGGDGTAAHLTIAPNTKPTSARVSAFRLLEREDIANRIAELRGHARAIINARRRRVVSLSELAMIEEDTVAVTAASLIEKADRVFEAAMAADYPQFGAAVAALTLQAKLAGLLNGDNAVDRASAAKLIDAPPGETMEQWLERRRRAPGMLVAPNRSANGRDPGDMVQ